MRRPVLRGAALFLALLAARPEARAEEPEEGRDPEARVAETLERGLQLFGDLEYRPAIRELGPLQVDPAVTRAQRLEALELIALSHLILREEALARDVFRDLLAIDPDYELVHDDGSPKIREFFDAMREEVLPGYGRRTGVELEHSFEGAARAGRRLEIAIRAVRGAEEAVEVVLFWRREGTLAFARTQVRRVEEGRWRGSLEPPDEARGYRVEYYLEARGLAGAPVARLGDPESPLALEVGGSPRTKAPWYRRWYVFAAGGAAFLGVGSAILFTQGGSPPDGSLEPGRVTLSP